ncbi:MAG: arylsulfatase [Pseudomonadota bacterium]
MRHLIRMGQWLFATMLSPVFLMAHAEQPNFVVILVDDAGLMDFSSFGGEAQTPNIDALGAAGMSFSNYRTSPMCAPTRAMLLTGLTGHKAGVGALPEIMTPEQRRSPAYSQRLLPGVETVASKLKSGGYQTFMAGKWHLGHGLGDLPNHHGFDRSFTLDASGADNYEQKSFMPFYAEAPWFEDGEPTSLPDDFYSSEFLVDQMVEYLDGRDPEKPFFAYLPFLAIHIPVQAPREYTDRYTGVYEDGWDATRERRIQRAKDLGLIPENTVTPDVPDALREWDELSPEDRAHYERRMMVNAGMLDAMDHHIGRLVNYLKSTGAYENTVFIVTSDNGPEFGEPNLDSGFRSWMSRNGYNDDFETLGEKGSNIGIGAEWASAAAGPSHLFKTFASEGGMRVPLIISGPGISSEAFNDARAYVTDLAPTLSDLAGLETGTVDGRSLAPLLKGEREQVYGEDDAVGFELGGNSALYKGRYKLTRNTLPFGDAEWRLYDIQADPSETNDLSSSNADLKKTMLEDYDRFAAENGVIALPKDYNPYVQLRRNANARVLQRNLPRLICYAAIVLVGLGLIVFFLLRWRSRRASA